MKQELPSEFRAQHIEYCTFFWEDSKVVMRAYRSKQADTKTRTQMSALIHTIRYGIGSLNLTYLLVLPLVIVIGMLEFYVVFVVSDFQYLDILITVYPSLFLFYAILIISSAILISYGLIRLGFFLIRHTGYFKLRRWRVVLLILLDVITIWGTFVLFTTVLSPANANNILLYVPLFITFWSVIWAFAYMRLRFVD